MSHVEGPRVYRPENPHIKQLLQDYRDHVSQPVALLNGTGTREYTSVPLLVNARVAALQEYLSAVSITDDQRWGKTLFAEVMVYAMMMKAYPRLFGPTSDFILRLTPTDLDVTVDYQNGDLNIPPKMHQKGADLLVYRPNGCPVVEFDVTLSNRKNLAQKRRRIPLQAPTGGTPVVILDLCDFRILRHHVGPDMFSNFLDVSRKLIRNGYNINDILIYTADSRWPFYFQMALLHSIDKTEGQLKRSRFPYPKITSKAKKRLGVAKIMFAQRVEE